MRELVRGSKISGIAAAGVAIWLLCAGPAWAGGGMDAGALQSLLCDTFASQLMISCPQYPTYLNTPTGAAISPPTPIVVELAAWENSNPDTIRITDSDCKLGGTLAGALY